MKILFFTTPEADYLQDSVLHGLRCLFGNDLVDYPKKNILYKDYSGNNIYGRGFTLYKILNDIEVDRKNILDKIKSRVFELIIFGSIHRQKELFYNYVKHLNKDNTILLDGEDTPILFPNHWLYKTEPIKLFSEKLYNVYPYFKREITEETNYYRYLKLIPKSITNKMPLPKRIQPISFSIPEEKIVNNLPVKKKLFPKHIVDEEVASKVEGSFTKYAFDDEKDYYEDLQSSKFGITTKRSGWDCMRHYEIAANGAVICFKDFAKKPIACAPHGLIDSVNCISYKNYDDLIHKISTLADDQYNAIQKASISWVNNNTTVKRATEVLTNFS